MPNQTKLDPKFILEELENDLMGLLAKDGIDSEVIFQEFDQLKNLISSKNITPKNIEWFLYSDLFGLMLNDQENFSVPLTDTYTLLLTNSNISNKKTLVEHKNILSEKINRLDDKYKEIFFQEFGSNLEKVKPQLKAKIRSSTLTKESIFFKPPNTKKLSPIALKALDNNFKKYLKI